MPNGCLLWTGWRLKSGYGILVIKRVGAKIKFETAHRLAYIEAYGEIPAEKPWICHRCDVPNCIEPTHLFAGTPSDNMRDCWNKGRGFMPGGVYGEDHPSARTTWEAVRFIRDNYCDGRKPVQGKMSGRQLTDHLGLTYRQVIQIASRTTWRERS